MRLSLRKKQFIFRFSMKIFTLCASFSKQRLLLEWQCLFFDFTKLSFQWFFKWPKAILEAKRLTSHWSLTIEQGAYFESWNSLLYASFYKRIFNINKALWNHSIYLKLLISQQIFVKRFARLKFKCIKWWYSDNI